MFHGTGRGITVGGVTKWARTFFESGAAGNSVTVDRALQGGLQELNVYGWCVQNGTPTPVNPVDIECNNGIIKYSANMANVNAQTALVGYYISAQGAVIADSYNWIYRAFIPCKPNTVYTLSMSQSVYFVSISEYSTPENSGFIVRKTGSTGTNTSLTITTGANTNFLRFGTNLDRTPVTLEEVLAINWMLNEGSTAIPYAPYYAGGIYTDGTDETLTVTDENGNTQTATMPMLLGVGDVYDIAKLVEKIKAGKVGIKVLNGTENFTVSASGAMIMQIPDVAIGAQNVPLNTHFALENSATSIAVGKQRFGSNGSQIYSTNYYMKHTTITTVPEFKAWLAAQYANGTPVIIIYPLATENPAVIEIITINFARWLNTVAVNKTNSIARNLFDGYYKKML